MKEFRKIRGTLPTVKTAGRAEIPITRGAGRLGFILPRRLGDAPTLLWGTVGFVFAGVAAVTFIAAVSNRPLKDQTFEPPQPEELTPEQVVLPEKERVIVNLAAMHGKTKSGCHAIFGRAPRLRMAGSDLWEIDKTAITATYNDEGKCYSVAVEIPTDAEVLPIETIAARLGFEIDKITEPNQQTLRAQCTGPDGEQWSCEAARGDQLRGFSMVTFRAAGVTPREPK